MLEGTAVLGSLSARAAAIKRTLREPLLWRLQNLFFLPPQRVYPVNIKTLLAAGADLYRPARVRTAQVNLSPKYWEHRAARAGVIVRQLTARMRQTMDPDPASIERDQALIRKLRSIQAKARKQHRITLSLQSGHHET